jgi:hypothetical protein
MTPDAFWAAEMQNRRLQQEQEQYNQAMMLEGFGQIADAYSKNKQLEAKAGSYDEVGKILGSAMFSNNPDAMDALKNLQKEKDARKKVMGYDQLFSVVGPMSNMMMAQGRMGVQQDQQQLTARIPGLRNAATAQAQMASGQGRVTTMPSNINPDVIP